MAQLQAAGIQILNADSAFRLRRNFCGDRVTFMTQTLSPPLTGPSSHSYISQRLRLHYADWGTPEAPPLLLVHGGRDHCRNWDWVAQELRNDWHVICPDLRGHGDSQWAPDGNYDMPAFVYDLAQLIHQLDLAPVTIIAHSMGGNISTRYTGLYPENVRKLVCIEGLGPSPAVRAEREGPGMANRFRMDRRQARSLTPTGAALPDHRGGLCPDEGRE